MLRRRGVPRESEVARTWGKRTLEDGVGVVGCGLDKKCDGHRDWATVGGCRMLRQIWLPTRLGGPTRRRACRASIIGTSDSLLEVLRRPARTRRALTRGNISQSPKTREEGRRSEAGDKADGGLGIWRRLPVRAGRKEWRRGEEGVWVMGWTRMWKVRGNGMRSRAKREEASDEARGVIYSPCQTRSVRGGSRDRDGHG